MKNAELFVARWVPLCLFLSIGCGAKDLNKMLGTDVLPNPDQHLDNAAADKSADQKSADQKFGSVGGSDAVQKRQCGLSFQVTTTGGTFLPEVCQFEKEAGGAECKDPDLCKAGNVINLTVKGNALGQIKRVSLFHIRDFASGTYRFDGDTARDFAGTLTDRGGVIRILNQGTLTLEARGSDQVQVSFDALFSGGIKVQGTGLLAVKSVSAP